MSRFPALKSIALVLKLCAVLAIAAGVILAVAEETMLLRVGTVAGGLLAALVLWAFSELISVALSIEANTWKAQQALTRSNTVAWTPASSRSSIPSPDAEMTSTV